MYLAAAGLLYGCGSPGAKTQPGATASIVSETARADAHAPTVPSSGGTETSAVSSEPTSSTPEMSVVAAAAVARVMRDNSLGGSVVFDRVNIVDRYGSPRSDGFLDVASDSPVIGAGVRAAVELALRPMSVTWVGHLSDVIGAGQAIPTYQEVGPVLTLSLPNVNGDQALITTGLWCGGACGAGGTYTVKWTQSQGWLVTGTQGPQWIA